MLGIQTQIEHLIVGYEELKPQERRKQWLRAKYRSWCTAKGIDTVSADQTNPPVAFKTGREYNLPRVPSMGEHIMRTV